jgi:hypothetical protein
LFGGHGRIGSVHQAAVMCQGLSRSSWNRLRKSC